MRTTVYYTSSTLEVCRQARPGESLVKDNITLLEAIYDDNITLLAAIYDDNITLLAAIYDDNIINSC